MTILTTLCGWDMLPRNVIRSADLIASAGANTAPLAPATWWRIELRDALLVLDRIGSGWSGGCAAAHRCRTSHSLSALFLGRFSAGRGVNRRHPVGCGG